MPDHRPKNTPADEACRLDRPVVPPVPERWAPRDASWLNRPHIGGLLPRWHLVGADDAPACGYPTLLNIPDPRERGMQPGVQPPSESMKCARCLAWLKRHNDQGKRTPEARSAVGGPLDPPVRPHLPGSSN